MTPASITMHPAFVRILRYSSNARSCFKLTRRNVMVQRFVIHCRVSTLAAFTLFTALRRNTRPGRALLGAPSTITSSPLTQTRSIPVDRAPGFSMDAYVLVRRTFPPSIKKNVVYYLVNAFVLEIRLHFLILLLIE
jgi:hypothetical protein